MKILIIENDDVLTREITTFLRTEGCSCEIAGSAGEVIKSFYYDAIIFNINTLNTGEIEILRLIKQVQAKHRTILTYQKDNISPIKLEALEMIALPKPYTMPELFQHVQQVVRVEKTEEETLFFNELIVDVPGRTARVKDLAINLTRKEFDLLVYLVRHRFKVLSKNNLVAYLSSDNEAVLYVHMKNLKKKLKEAGCGDYIKTVYGIGYRFQR
jgi:DNA-binding response OmpR family regulator